MSTYTRFLRPLLFQCEPEWIHDRALDLAQRVGHLVAGRHILQKLYGFDAPRLTTQMGGLQFAHPVGLAAGFDKNGRAVEALAAVGFSHVEVGSVSADASAGNPAPRLFRLPQDEAIVVNYGVPNEGADVIARRLAGTPVNVPLGVNLVETNTGQPTIDAQVVAEYIRAARPFCSIADYLTLNLNCPNTTGGVSPFDDMGRLADLLGGLEELAGLPPILLKFTAHRDPRRADDLLTCVDSHRQVAGLIFNLPPGKHYDLATPARIVDPLPGTLCGAPTRQMMDDTLAFWAARIDRSRLGLVGSGGITGAADAYRKIRLGASLLQLYSALIYAGPGIIRSICDGLLQRLDRDGFAQLSDAIGVDVPAPPAAAGCRRSIRRYNRKGPRPMKQNSDTLSASWAREGHVVVRGLLSPAVTDQLRDIAEGTLAQWRSRNPETVEPGGNAEATTMRHLNHPAYHHQDAADRTALLSACADPAILEVAAALLGDEPLFRCTSLFFNPRANSRDGHWHRDSQFHCPDEEDEKRMVAEGGDSGHAIQLQIALVPSDDVEVVPGSHLRWDTPAEYEIRRAEDGRHSRRNDMPGAMRVDLAAGDAVAFNPMGLHRGRYHTDKPRRTLMLTYTSLRHPRFDYFSDQPWFDEEGYLDGLTPAQVTFFERFISAYADQWRENSQPTDQEQ